LGAAICNWLPLLFSYANSKEKDKPTES